MSTTPVAHDEMIARLREAQEMLERGIEAQNKTGAPIHISNARRAATMLEAAWIYIEGAADRLAAANAPAREQVAAANAIQEPVAWASPDCMSALKRGFDTVVLAHAQGPFQRPLYASPREQVAPAEMTVKEARGGWTASEEFALEMTQVAPDGFSARENMEKVLNQCDIPTPEELDAAKQALARQDVGELERLKERLLWADKVLSALPGDHYAQVPPGAVAAAALTSLSARLAEAKGRATEGHRAYDEEFHKRKAAEAQLAEADKIAEMLISHCAADQGEPDLLVSEWKHQLERADTFEQQVKVLSQCLLMIGCTQIIDAATGEITGFNWQPGSAEARIATLTYRAAPFVAHYEPWMDKYDDDVPMSVFARVTFGQVRALRAALEPQARSAREKPDEP